MPLPRWDNRVEVGADGRIMLTYTPNNLEAHQRLTARFRSLLEAMRCRQETIDRATYLGGRLGISGVAHQNGTVRYVVDSSFFVSSTASNPTLTIIANALRVADHLRERLGAPAAPTPR